MPSPPTSSAATGANTSSNPAAKPAKPKQDTPAMRQYKHFKQQHPGCVLFFRMGDFYEMFYEDAVLAHKTMGVTLTQRTEGVPMAGVPYHSVEGYLRKMIQAGHRVAVCEQVEDAAQAKGVVKRDVTRVVTPGTLTDESLMDEGRENPLAAVVFHTEAVSLAWVELSTGSFSVATLSTEEAADELARVAPSELLYCELATGELPPRVDELKQALGCAVTGRPGWQFRIEEAAETLRRQYGVAQLTGFGFRDDDPALMAAGAVVAYLNETQRSAAAGNDASGDGVTASRLGHLRPPRRFERAAHLVIDQTSLRSLEVDRTLRTGQVDGSLLGCFRGPSAPATAMGKRQLRQWLCYPLADRGPIELRQRVVQAMVDDPRFRDELREAVDAVHDIERIAARLSVGRATPRDLVALGNSVGQVRRLHEVLDGRPNEEAYLQRVTALLDPLTKLSLTILDACIDAPPAHLREGGLIADGHDAKLDEYRALQSDSHAWLARYQARLLEEHQIPHLKVGYNKVFGYYIELSAVNRDRAPDTWSRKQTLKNAERFITPELKEFEGKVLSAESRAVAREQELFAGLCRGAAGLIDQLHGFAAVVAELDVLGAFARRSVLAKYVKPTIVDEPVLHIESGRHPVLDELLGDQFVPNDLELSATDGGKTASLALITGPNMAGKSTYIRQAALITLLAHTGCFVPADSATVGLTDRIFTRVGANDELHAGQSTFMVEMTETANICHHATERSLVILDEIGRGTSTLDGLSLAWAIAEHLAGGEQHAGPRTLFATHYHEITTLAQRYPQVTNLSVTVREWQDQIVFLHRIAPGAADRSYGIHVAKIAGLPDPVITRANQLLSELAVNHAQDGFAHAAAYPPDPKANPKPPPQMSLFTEYLPHPAIKELQALELDSMTPLEAFDVLRKLDDQVRQIGD
ncbi:MAG: DNA mismatch repair protein MutS [Planctomycetota bacterium]